MRPWSKSLTIGINSVFLLSALVLPTEIFGLNSTESSSDKLDKNTAILVLDASGSMWGQIDGKAKITIAREVISEIVKDWEQGSSLGLIAYGHNNKGDCNDIELLQRPEVIDKSTFLKKIHKLNPKGKTPLTAAVKRAAEVLKYTEDKATVVLISDGKETCNLDPCEAGRALRKAGIDFTTHVISFDVPETESAGLRCLARETGGLFLAADNADELKDALSETSKIVTDKEELKITDASVNVPNKVIAGSQFEAEWKGPKNKYDKLIIKSPDGKRLFDATYIGREDISSPSKITAPETPGEYFVHYYLRDNRSLAKTKLKVIPAKASIKAAASITAGSEFEVEWSGPKNKFDVLGVFKANSKDRLTYTYIFRDEDESPAKVKAPEQPGEYEVRYFTNGKNTLAKQAITIVPALASVKAPGKIVAGSAFDVEWSGPKNKFDVVAVFKPNARNYLSHTYIFRDNDESPARVTAPEQPGDYELRYYTNGKKTLAKQLIKVIPATASVRVPEQVIAGAKFEVEWSGPKNKFDVVAVFKPNARKYLNHTYIFRERDKSPAFVNAPETPGTYEVRYYTNGKRTLAKQNFTVIPATASVSAPSQVKAGMKFSVEWQGPKNKFDVVTVFSDDGKKQFDKKYIRDNSKSPISLKAPKVPGKYQVRYFTNGKNTLASQKFEVVE
ncbi:MAG: VWA domain-containing protein [Kangiellaceae bacterium]|nr:VWA domain-containing protein [Kangiellaceae bacterium]